MCEAGDSMNNWSNLAKIVYKRTYARDLITGKENWKDTVARVIRGNVNERLLAKHPNLLQPNELQELEYFLTNRKAGPAGRGWWFSGTDSHATLGGVALNNCYYLSGDRWENLAIAQDLLLLGGGVGMSVEHRYVSKLPKVRKEVKVIHHNSKDADFIVPDSREGWCELTRKTLEAYFVTGKSFSYSTVCIRGHGERIKGFGGKASGPIPLIDCIQKISGVLNNREGKHIRPEDMADLICCIGEMVVSGNVRRSAIIILGDCWDKDYLKMKRWDLGPVPTQRAMANFSVVVDDVDDLHPYFWKTYEQGEPFGIVNRKTIQKFGRMGEIKKDTAEGVNPCQPAYATVLTPEGIRIFADIDVGSVIWSGKQWTKVIRKWSTGVKPVFKYTTTRGHFLGTENHKIFENGQRVEVGQAESIDFCVGPVPDFKGHNSQDVIDGLVLGDGSVHKASNNLVHLFVRYKEQHDYLNELSEYFIKERKSGLSNSETATVYEVKTTIKAQELPYTYQRSVPERFFFGDNKTKASFLRGLYSANGTVIDSRISLKQTSKLLIDQVQLMLSSLGINSYVTTNKSHENQFNNGLYTCKTSYDLHITTDKSKFVELIGFIQKYKMEKIGKSGKSTSQTSDIKSVEYLEDCEVFDITVDAEEHTYWTGGCLVSNCAEATLESGEPCVDYNTYLLTKEGRTKIGDAVGKQIQIWNGQKWSSVTPFVASESSDFYRIEFSDGSYLNATPGHKFLIRNRFQSKFKELTTLELENLLKTSKYPVFVPVTTVEYQEGLSEKDSYSYGFFLGDGSVCNTARATLYGAKIDLPLEGRRSEVEQKEGYNVKSVKLSMDNLSVEFCKALKCEDLPEIIFSWDRDSILNFISGWLDADGSNASNGVRLYTTEPRARTAQLLLRKCGISSSVNLMDTKDSVTTMGVRNQDIWYLQIYNTKDLSCKRLKVGNTKLPKSKGINQIVRSVTKLAGQQPSYCLTEPENHTALFNNVLTKQCNLQEIFLNNIKDEEEFIKAARLMHRWGKRVTCEKYHIEEVDRVVQRNRRIGTGITGCLQSSLFTPAVLDRAYQAIQDENISYSKILGIPESIRTTVIKPSGTMSKMGDSACEGIHPAYSRYAIQRVRFSANDSLIPKLKAAGHYMEPVLRFDGTLDHNTLVVDFYIQAPEDAPVADEGWSTWEQLNVVKMAQKHWADQSVSVTVYYKRDEIPKLKEWLRDNLHELKTISFLCHSDHGFKQAPKEAITQTQFEKLSSKIKPLEFDDSLIEEEQTISSLECEGGACPIR